MYKSVPKWVFHLFLFLLAKCQEFIQTDIRLFDKNYSELIFVWVFCFFFPISCIPNLYMKNKWDENFWMRRKNMDKLIPTIGQKIRLNKKENERSREYTMNNVLFRWCFLAGFVCCQTYTWYCGWLRLMNIKRDSFSNATKKKITRMKQSSAESAYDLTLFVKCILHIENRKYGIFLIQIGLSLFRLLNLWIERPCSYNRLFSQKRKTRGRTFSWIFYNQTISISKHHPGNISRV